MKDDRIQIKGNKDGVNITIDTEKFIGFDDMLEVLVSSLSINKGFYKNSILKITANFKHISNSDISKLKDELFQKINIKDCVFDDISKVKKETSQYNEVLMGFMKEKLNLSRRNNNKWTIG